MSHKLHISDALSLPLEAVTQTFADLAKRGAGKTYLASVLAEEMLKAGQTIIALDPTGAWWGLRSAFSVAVLGGEHGDIPLQETAGELIAQAVVDNRFPAVIDLSLFRKGAMIRFMVGFLETLYRLNRDPVHLFVDEADAFAPQGRNFGGEENRMLGAMEDIVRRGRKRGIGCTLITQRPAVLNKNVLTQCENVFALRMVHPRDIGALKEWIDVHAEPSQSKEVIDSLPSLPIGDAWFWSPGWMGTLKRIHVRQRETFDSSATPKPGEKAKKPKSLAELDLAALGKQIEATVEKVKADDPRELRRKMAEQQKKIMDLEKQLKDRPTETIPEVRIERVEVPVLKNGLLEKAAKVIDRLAEITGPLNAAFAKVAAAPAVTPPSPTLPISRPKPTPITRPPATPRPAARAVEVVEGELTGPEQRILDAIAWLESIGIQSPEQTAVAFLAGYTYGGGAFNNPRGSLRTKGLVEYVAGDCIMLSDAGRELAKKPEAALTSEELHRMVMERLPGPERKLLSVLLEVYPNDLSNEELAERTGYSLGGAFNNPKGRLRTLGLAEYPSPGRVRARSILFL